MGWGGGGGGGVMQAVLKRVTMRGFIVSDPAFGGSGGRSLGRGEEDGVFEGGGIEGEDE